ncbi:MAG: hypothetical protein M0R51_05370 [Clostridia bacterium]|nr:hypothetical protein [Clostridia bacterium]
MIFQANSINSQKTLSSTTFTAIYKENVSKLLTLTGSVAPIFPATFHLIPGQFTYDGAKKNVYVLLCTKETTTAEVTYQLINQY